MFEEKDIQIIPIIFILLLIFVTTYSPQFLALPNYAWTKFGKVMNSLVSPIILGVIYYLIITPTGFFVKKILRKKFLDLHKDDNLKSYWIERKMQEYNPENFKRLY